MAAKIRFYLDENIPIAVAVQLQRRGIDAVTVRDLDLLGESDLNHLLNALAEKRVLCTHDSDYLQMVQEGAKHAGIVFGQQAQHGIGDWVAFLELVHSVYTVEEMFNRVEYI